MAKKRSKDAQKRRVAKRHRRAVTRRQQARRFALPEDPALRSGLFASVPERDRLSNRIWEFAAPLIDAAVDTQGQKKAVGIAIICWNVALLPENRGLQSLRPRLRALSDHDRNLEREFLDLFDMMQARKRMHFDDDRRFVMNYSLTETDGGLHLLVASTPVSPEQAAAAFPV